MISSNSLILAVAFFFCIAAKQHDDGLFLVHIITRHGERTPTHTFPKDEYKNESFYPVGHGRLTNAGKKRMYDTGLFLKDRYKNFLGNFYLPNQVEVMSSEYDRTQMTAQLLMAAMYPPKTAQIWNSKLNWQPIPIKYTRREDDFIFLPESSCKKFMELRSTNEEDQRKQGNFQSFEPLFKSLQKRTGVKVTLPSQVTKIHDTLKCQVLSLRSFGALSRGQRAARNVLEYKGILLRGDLTPKMSSFMAQAWLNSKNIENKEWGLQLPSWAHDVYPEAMEKVVDRYWATFADTDDLKRLGAGAMFKNIIDDITKKINGTVSNREMKLHVYSAHDSCIVPMLQLLDVFDGQGIPYGAYILIEIHKKGKDYTVKVYYQNNKQMEPRIVHPNKCSNPCSFNDFVNNYKKYFGELNMC